VEVYLGKKNKSLEYKKCAPMTMQSIILLAGGAKRMMVSARIECIILSVPPAESTMLSAHAESTILLALSTESMMLSAQGHACALTLRARSCTGGAESIILSVLRV
jgi:hypothetical protein